jgi:lipopolysaccharide assembly outer membrane protein LptD (OstA)
MKPAGGIHNLISRRDGWRINIDLSNTSEVCVANFDYKVFYDGALLLKVRSKRATTSNKCPDEVTLRGHVTISTGDGTTLESNCVIWDIPKQQFTVDGTYFLTRNGKKIRGKDICVDDKLNIVQAQIAALKEKGKENG